MQLNHGFRSCFSPRLSSDRAVGGKHELIGEKGDVHRELLQDLGSVEIEDGEEHRHRKAMLLFLMATQNPNLFEHLLIERWPSDLAHWERERTETVVVHHQPCATHLCKEETRHGPIPNRT